jgi:hypothetical protein
MKKFLKSKAAAKALYIILAFLLSLFIVAGSMCALLKITVMSPKYFNESLNGSGYYADLCSEITDGLKDIGDASGLDKSFFEDIVNETLVRKDVQNYVSDFYSGKKLSVDTSDFEKDLRSALAKYERAHNIKMTDYSEKNVDYFVNEAAKIYAANIKINYLGAIQKTALKLDKALTIATIVLGVLSLAVLLFIFFSIKWKHKALRYIYYAFCSAGLFIASIPAAIFATGFIGKIAILSKSLNDLYTGILNSLFTDMLVMGGVLAVIALATAVLSFVIRRKVSA